MSFGRCEAGRQRVKTASESKVSQGEGARLRCRCSPRNNAVIKLLDLSSPVSRQCACPCPSCECHRFISVDSRFSPACARGLRFALLRSSQSADAFQCVMRSAAIAVHVSVHVSVHALIKEFKSLESEFSCVCVCVSYRCPGTVRAVVPGGCWSLRCPCR